MDVLCGRLRSAEHWAAARELCGALAREGRGVGDGEKDFFAEFWVDPYRLLRPGWTFAALVDGRFAGYLTGCPDTPRFRRERRLRQRLPLVLGALSGRWGRSAAVRSFLRRSFALEVDPGELPPSERERIEARYPAHLHMNVSPAFQRRGVGRVLLGRLFEELGSAGVPGAHLICGAGAEGFYARAGFETLTRWEPVPGVTLRAMGRPT
ncbi:MAG: GNAT family N-acetyltransferase [Elusimicrobiota bacterium]|jgi:GNAT superfamily N-acetyltransferase